MVKNLTRRQVEIYLRGVTLEKDDPLDEYEKVEGADETLAEFYKLRAAALKRRGKKDAW